MSFGKSVCTNYCVIPASLLPKPRLEDGEISEYGTRSDLLEMNGTDARLYKIRANGCTGVAAYKEGPYGPSMKGRRNLTVRIRLCTLIIFPDNPAIPDIV